MEMTFVSLFWVTLVVGFATLLASLISLRWNDIHYSYRLGRHDSGGAKLPPGSMGMPFLGETLTFLWYFRFLRRPDDYINSKRQKYGDGAGLYRTHLFSWPAIIAWTTSANKFVLQNKENFSAGWPTMELVGTSSLIAAEGEAHTRVRGFVVRAIDQPDVLRKIVLMVQPNMVSAMESWAEKGRIVAYKEIKKLTFRNMGKYFANLEPVHVLDTLDELYEGLLHGLRSYPLNFPGTAYYHALQCRRKAYAIFREEMEKRKRNDNSTSPKYDLMEGLMKLKDESGNSLTEAEVLENITSLVIDGYASTSMATMWAVYYLAASSQCPCQASGRAHRDIEEIEWRPHYV